MLYSRLPKTVDMMQIALAAEFNLRSPLFFESGQGAGHQVVTHIFQRPPLLLDWKYRPAGNLNSMVYPWFSEDFLCHQVTVLCS